MVQPLAMTRTDHLLRLGLCQRIQIDSMSPPRGPAAAAAAAGRRRLHRVCETATAAAAAAAVATSPSRLPPSSPALFGPGGGRLVWAGGDWRAGPARVFYCLF